jgi:hypothetical protein
MILRNEIREISRIVGVIQAILDDIRQFDKGNSLKSNYNNFAETETMSDRVTHLLTLLYNALQSSQSLSGNNAEHKTLWDLFINSMMPYVSIMEGWIFDGQLNDENEEFMISK